VARRWGYVTRPGRWPGSAGASAGWPGSLWEIALSVLLAVAADGESVLMPTPVRCTIHPLALRVRVPRNRPGVPEPRPALDWTRLRRQALTFTPGG
jgi:hypothetical protein